MPNGMYGGVRGKGTKTGQKTFVPRPTRLYLPPFLWVSPKTQLYSFSGTNMTNMVYFAVFYHSR